MAQRAAALLQRKHRASGDSASPSSTLADISAPTAMAANTGDGAPGGMSAAVANPLSPAADARQGGRGKRSTKQPCEACGEADARDCATCCLCGARCHLMCFFPPWEAVTKGERWKCTACACAPPLPLAEQVPVPGEALLVEVQTGKGAGVVWQQAVVRKAKGQGRFTVCVNGARGTLIEPA